MDQRIDCQSRVARRRRARHDSKSEVLQRPEIWVIELDLCEGCFIRRFGRIIKSGCLTAPAYSNCARLSWTINFSAGEVEAVDIEGAEVLASGDVNVAVKGHPAALGMLDGFGAFRESGCAMWHDRRGTVR